MQGIVTWRVDISVGAFAAKRIQSKTPVETAALPPILVPAAYATTDRLLAHDTSLELDLQQLSLWTRSGAQGASVD